MKTSLKKKFTSLILAWAMIVAPVIPAYAQTATPATGPYDFNTYCSPAAQAASGVSDQTSAYCTQAATSQTAIKFQTMKEILMLASGVTLTALAFMPLGQGPACKIDSNVADVAGLGLDVTQSIKTKSLSSAMISGITTIGSLAITDGITAMGKQASEALIGGVAKIDSTSDNTACLVDAGLAFAQAGVSILSAHMAKTAEQSALGSVASLLAARTPGSSSFSLSNNITPSAGSSGTASGAQAATQVNGTCSGQGAAYLACLSKGDPVSAAITANPNLMNAVGQAAGQSPSALAQGYNGDGSPASVAGYVGGAMGLSPTGTAALQKTLDTSAQLASKGDYKPATYAASGSSAATATGATGDVDFGKVMSGMMSKLAPDTKTGEDPSTVVYRQLDLLPASKIETNKDISLFARIGYRYRKASGDVEQLNWSNPANQTVDNTPIGQTSTNRIPAASKN
jgi:hypothetical protein